MSHGGDLLGRLVDEDAHPLDSARDLGDYRFHIFDGNVALTPGEDEAEQVDAELDREFDILGPRVAADLDLRHCPLSSRTFASRSGARRSDSPTSAASTPSRSSASISARLSMPLPLPTTWAGGAKRSNPALGSLPT